MSHKEVDYITSNEQHVRSRIYDGKLEISDAADYLLSLEKSQHEATRRLLAHAHRESASNKLQLLDARKEIEALKKRLEESNDIRADRN